MRFEVGTPCRAANTSEVENRIRLLQNVGFYNPRSGGFLELVGPISDFDENWDRTIAVAYPHREWFKTLHSPYAQNGYLFTGATDMSTPMGYLMAKRAVEMAQALGIRKVVLHTDVLCPSIPEKHALTRMQRSTIAKIGQLADFAAREMKVEICVENMARPNAFRDDGTFFEAMEYHRVDQLAHDAATCEFSLTYDICHGATMAKDVAKEMRCLGDVLGHVHLSDIYPNSEYLVEGATPVHPESIIGEIGWEDILNAIPDGMTVTLEVYEQNVLQPVNSRQALDWIVRHNAVTVQ